MEFSKAQHDMRYGYLNGATGAIVSACIWLAAGVVAITASEQSSMLTLFIGGMFIFPLSVLSAKLLGRPGHHGKGNPLGALALESTAILFAGLVLAYGVSLANIVWFYPAMLLVIGVRYLVFQSLYGLKIYWLLGAALILSAAILVMLQAPFYLGALVGSAVEYGFGFVLLQLGRKSSEDVYLAGQED